MQNSLFLWPVNLNQFRLESKSLFHSVTYTLHVLILIYTVDTYSDHFYRLNTVWETGFNHSFKRKCNAINYMTAKTKNWSEGVTFILLLASAKHFVLKRRRKDWLILFVVSVASSQQGAEMQNSTADLNARVFGALYTWGLWRRGCLRPTSLSLCEIFFLIHCVTEDAGKEVAVCCKERGQAAQSGGVVNVQRMQSTLFYAKLR